MACCFKPQKEKYEFGALGPDGTVNQDNNNKKLSAKTKKRHSKILMNELPQLEPLKDEDVNKQSQDKEKDNKIDNNANSISVPAIVVEETDESNGDKHSKENNNFMQEENKKGHTPDVENQTPTILKRESQTHSDTSESKHNSKTIENHKPRPQGSESVEDNNNNSIKEGKVLVITRNSIINTGSNKDHDSKKKILRSSSNIENQRKIVKRKDNIKEKGDGSKVKGKSIMDGDLYKEPPTDTQKYDEWKEGNDEKDVPPPDYSDSEHEDEAEDYEELRKNVKNRISAILTREEWDKIVEKSGTEDEDALGVEIPEPDYDGAPNKNRPLGRSHTFNVGGPSENAHQKKALLVPGMDSKARQEINRELMMNQKMGIDVLHRKSELKKELDRRKDREKAKLKEQPRKNSLEIKLQEMATKLHKNEDNNNKEEVIQEEDEASQPEFLRVHSKINKTKTGS